MKIGLFLWQPTPDMQYSHTARLNETRELAVLGEELSFDSVMFAENHFSNYGYSPNPILLAAAIGQHTSQIRFATGVAVLPYWHPIRLAEDVAVADQLLGGRLDICVGRGYQQLEFAGFGIPYEERQQRYDEALDILVGAWTSTDFQYSGSHYTVSRPVNVLPKPFQTPHPRISVAAVSDESVRAAAATDFKVLGSSLHTSSVAASQHDLYLNERSRLGRSGDFWVNSMNRQVYVIDPLNRREYERAREETWLRSQRLSRLGEGLRRNTVEYRHGEVLAAPIEGERDLEDYANSVIFGTAEEVLQQFRVLRDEYDVQEVNVMTDFGGLEHARARRSIELLGREVLPSLREDEARGVAT